MGKTREDLVKEWLIKHDFGGSQSWWDAETRYSLTCKDIIKIVTYINRLKR